MTMQESHAGQSDERKDSDLEREWLVCRMKAMIRQAWPEEFGLKRADLKVVKPNGRMVWPKKARARNLAKMRAARAATATRRKSGGMVPMKDAAPPTLAKVFAFPGALIGDDLYEQYEWMGNHSEEWQTTETHGREPFNRSVYAIIQGARAANGLPPTTEHAMRKDIQAGRTRIEKRNRVKAYLERRGVNLDDVRNAEEALFRLFDLMGEGL